MWPVEPLKCTAWQTVKKSESYNMILKSKPIQIECNIKPILNSCLHLQSISLLPVLRRGVWKEQQQRPQSLLPEIRASQRKVRKAGKPRSPLLLKTSFWGWWDDSRQLASKNTTWVRCTRSYEDHMKEGGNQLAQVVPWRPHGCPHKSTCPHCHSHSYTHS